MFGPKTADDGSLFISNDWKTGAHFFPMIGKLQHIFSNGWKFGGYFFQ
jgi:hypothetical protein